MILKKTLSIKRFYTSKTCPFWILHYLGGIEPVLK